MKHTKQQLAELVRAGVLLETFVFHDGTVYAVSPMRKLAIKTKKPQYAHLHKQFIDSVRECRDIDWERVAALTEDDLRDPILLVNEGNNVCTVIDGAHRVMRLAQMNAPAFKYFLFEKDECILIPVEELPIDDNLFQWGEWDVKDVLAGKHGRE